MSQACRNKNIAPVQIPFASTKLKTWLRVSHEL